ncbi:flagellar hook protein FlgE [Telmatobacter bradus]|uniref:flagellar hook protein FlgE n=1 Tax=Telmatobacter bradus TaxID=474953 RepID=UPI003B42A27C
MPNFSIALSGLDADATSLDTIANNLSNMSTTAYKTHTTKFSDAFYESLGTSGAGNPIAKGTGAKVSGTSTDFTQGNFNTSHKTNSDMAINGEGFFVVKNSTGQYLTRDGGFTQNAAGQLVTTNGANLMGYAVTKGVPDTSKLAEVKLPTSGSVMSANASTKMTVTANLDSSTAVGGTYTSTATLYDSLGETHTATITYTKTANNSWNYSIALPASDYASGTATPITGSLAFDASGNLSTISSGGAASTVGTAPGNVSSIPLSFAGLSDGSNDMAINWNMLNSNNGQILTQTNSPSTTSSAVADGYTSGTYESFAVDTNGMVNATYSNGQTVAVGQVALADVANDQGLVSKGSGMYATTVSSGNMNVGTAGNGSLGTIEDNATEESNVDISTEFADLIVAQRAFEANSKSITTFDTVTQETINLIHS